MEGSGNIYVVLCFFSLENIPSITAGNVELCFYDEHTKTICMHCILHIGERRWVGGDLVSCLNGWARLNEAVYVELLGRL